MASSIVFNKIHQIIIKTIFYSGLRFCFSRMLLKVNIVVVHTSTTIVLITSVLGILILS